MDTTVVAQRVENLVVAAAIVVGFVELDFSWWWLLALFLLFDLSALGYAVVSPRPAAWMYNAVHNYVAPAALVIVALLADVDWAAFIGLAWAFHVAVDRALGFGLKFGDGFGHTHLGSIGRQVP